MTRKQTITYCRRIARLYGVNLCFSSSLNLGGTYDHWSNLITVKKNVKLDYLLSFFLHELNHYIASQENKYKIYHNVVHAKDTLKPTFLRTAWRAENYVDKKARELAELLAPWLEYKDNYLGDKNKKWLLNYYKRIAK